MLIIKECILLASLVTLLRTLKTKLKQHLLMASIKQIILKNDKVFVNMCKLFSYLLVVRSKVQYSYQYIINQQQFSIALLKLNVFTLYVSSL